MLLAVYNTGIRKPKGEIMKQALVAFFSATAATKHVADLLAESIDADLFEIVPKEIYSTNDLDWTNPKSRSSVEMKDKSSRPEIESHVRDMVRYDVVFLGFPIWWYREPSIIDTFVERHDFDGKTIVPFATSGGSGMGDSHKIIQSLAPKAHVEMGRVFDRGVSTETLKKWADKYL